MESEPSDKAKTKEQLIRELVEMRQRIVELERSETELKQIENELRESERHYRLLADNVTDIIWTMDMNLRYTYVSPSVTRLSGFSVEEARGQTLQEVLTPASFEAAIKALAEEEAIERIEEKDLTRWRMLELELYRKDRSTFWAEVTVTALREQDSQIVGFIGVARDITERKMMQERIRELYEVEKQQRRELEEEVKARTQFINTLAHELRTPLTPIVVCGEMLQDILSSTPGSTLIRLANDIVNSARTMASRLQELLDLAAFSSGAGTLHPQLLDVKSILEHAASETQFVADSKEQRLILDLPQTLSPIGVDRSRIEQVLIHLLLNASEFSPRDSEIIMRARVMENELVVEVENKGMGFSLQEQAMLFRPYHRVEQDRQALPGLGLGLALSKQIVEAHGGRMWLTSQLGKGSTFCFSLPCKSKESRR